MTNAISRRVARLEAATAEGVGKVHVLLVPHGSSEEEARREYATNGRRIAEGDRVISVHFVRAA